MPYKVHKLVPDNRVNTCGFFLPNGFYYVVEMTFENANQLINLSAIPGYSVDLVQGPTGMFTDDGFKVDEGSVRAGFKRKTKKVETYKKVTRESKYRGKVTEVPEKAEHPSPEREQMLFAAAKNGINCDFLSTLKIKQLVLAKGARVERHGSLGLA